MKKENKNNFIETKSEKEIIQLVVYSLILFVMGFVLLFVSINQYFFIREIVFVISVILIFFTVIWDIYMIFNLNKNKKNITKYIEDFSFATESLIRTAILAYPDPIVVVNSKGIIRWYNSAFSEFSEKNDLFGVKLQELFPSIRISAFFDSYKNVQEFSFGGRDFLLMGTVTDSSDKAEGNSILAISFSDISEINRLNKKLDDKRCVICTAIIDNYDEVLKETPATNHGSLIGDVERFIDMWVSKGDGFYCKLERDKFIIMFEAANFERLVGEKFSILDEVKEIDQQNKIPVTLSIGVGAIDADMTENNRISLTALDMALGRGGDQVVVKTDSGFEFYGAKSLGVEKTTKVKARVVAKSLSGLINASSKVMIIGHKNADFDSFGAAIGLYRAVTDMNKNAFIVMNRNKHNIDEILSDFLHQSKYSDSIISYDRANAIVDKNTLLIIVDTHRPSMVEYPELFEKVEKIALIDHHRRSEEFIENASLTYHEPYASSTCEMVTEILQYINEENGLTVQEAEAIYSGIYMDTKAFTFKTGARTFEAAAFLRKIGVDPIGVHKMFRNDLDMYIQKSKIISGARVYRDNIAIAICEESPKNIQLVVAQAADELLNINGIEAAFVLANLSNKIIISGRSLGGINVQVILEKLGGGGHSTIAGAQLENSSLTIAELKLHNAIDDVLFE